MTDEDRLNINTLRFLAVDAVERAGSGHPGWRDYVGERGDVIGLNRFGASAPGPVVLERFGFTVEHLVERARALVRPKNGARRVRKRAAAAGTPPS